MPQIHGLLVKVKGDGAAFAQAAKHLRAGALEVEPILRLPGGSDAGALAPDRGATWLKVRQRRPRSGNAWDEAHRLISRAAAFATAGGPDIIAVEPDFEQVWLHVPPDAGTPFAAAPVCAFDDQSSNGGQAIGPGRGWNLDAGFSQLAMARERVGSKQDNVLVAHLDTGYDPAHVTLPEGIRLDLQRNFVAGFPPDDARDRAPAGSLFANRGHGTGTLGILAGNRLDGSAPGWPGYDGFVGAAAQVRVVPVRIADWVVRLTTGTMVQGFDYARQKDADVLSMSMGGLSSGALVDAVNLAYESGIVLVTAAGNNIAFVPSPKSIVFPARYRRVIAACGLMADGRAYAGLAAGTMQGNFGPDSKMATALGAFTPNVPWPQIGCGNIVDMDGSGTSAATPQIAAAAALWLAEHRQRVSQYSRPWMRVEAVRHALFTSAGKSTAKMNAAETRQKIGQGVLRAHGALDVAPPAENRLSRQPPAEASWPWLDLVLGGGVSFAACGADGRQGRMLALELTQMAQTSAAVDAAMADPDMDAGEVPASARNRYLETALDHGNPSGPLRRMLEDLLARPARPLTASAVPAARPQAVRRKVRQPPTPARRLRIFSLDPSVGKRLDSVSVNTTTLSLPWDDLPETVDPLKPGPIGEYLEVIDVDPASDRVYDPVDLNAKTLLAQDGLTPSEGNPQFHQQMVYAVAMTTIGHFERALGRRALWAPRYLETRTRDGEMRYRGEEVKRLRIYPHALRTDNAYYSPDRKALLFGYFPADSVHGQTTSPGSMVFTCLSSDIIAHETSHALLDGLHRRLQEASNPDVPAFHEAFADIVALFQHFTLQELVEFEMARARGNLSAAGLLSGLARQFGEGSGRAGPLRDYAEPLMAELDYDKTMEPHERGSILVFAVYEAFLKIVARRTGDLILLATGGTGILPQGSLHPGLVRRLAEETGRAAEQVLTMCIRALDYCPAVDITFGEYLRALITADVDARPADLPGYRLAFMESFRNWKLLPPDVRTVSEETLAWNTLDDPSPPWLRDLLKDLDLGWNRDLDRSEIFRLNEKNRWRLWSALRKAFAADPSLYAQFGLLPGLPRYARDGRVLRAARKGQSTFDVFSVRPTRRVTPDGSFRTEVVAVIHQRQALPVDGSDMANGWFWFRGGATVIIDPRKGREEIRYSIVKNSGSAARQERQRQTIAANWMSFLHSLYFGERVSEPFAVLHRGEDHG
jgi:hypothetical protein